MARLDPDLMGEAHLWGEKLRAWDGPKELPADLFWTVMRSLSGYHRPYLLMVSPAQWHDLLDAARREGRAALLVPADVKHLTGGMYLEYEQGRWEITWHT